MKISVIDRLKSVKLTLNNKGESRENGKQGSVINQRFGLERNNYFLFSSKLIPEKGAHYLIKAYNIIKTEKMLVIEGDDTINKLYVKELKELALHNPNIIFTGIIESNLRNELLENAYIYILPSEREEVPINLYEAISFGKIAITSDIPTNEIVIGNYGLTFRSGDILDLADKLKRSELLEPNIEELGFKAKESIFNQKRIG